MILDHVSEHTGTIVIRAPALDADGFGNSELKVIDVVLVPERLENAVGKAKHQHVANGFFPQIVVDTENVCFVKSFQQDSVEIPRGCEIRPERFFDNDARVPGAAGPHQLFHDRSE